jgi:hypothetical protein
MAHRKGDHSGRQGSGNVKKNTNKRQPAPTERKQGDIFADFFDEPHNTQIGEESSGERQRQWISDHVMWEATLGMREDEAVNKALTPEEKKRQAQQRVTANQRRQTADSPDNVPPAQPGRRTNQGVPQRATRTAPTSQSPAKTGGAHRPRQNPPAKSSTESGRPTANRSREASARNRVKSQPTVKTSRAPVKPFIAENRPNTQAAPAQARPAVFEARDVQPQLHAPNSATYKKVSKFYRVIKFLLRHWAVTLIALTSFTAGYMLAATIHSPAEATTDSTSGLNKLTPAENPSVPASRKNSSKTKTTQQTNTSNRKLSEKRAQTKAADTNTAQAPTAFQTQNSAAPEPTPQARQFEGRDIPLTGDVEPKEGLAADTADFLNASQETSGSLEPEQAGDTDSSELNIDSDAGEENASNADTTDETLEQSDTLENLLDESLAKFENQEWDALIDLSTQALTLDSSNVPALINRSVAYAETGQFDLALNDCFLALQIEPENGLAINNRGYTYEKMGDLENALADYQTACELGVGLSCDKAARLAEVKNQTQE